MQTFHKYVDVWCNNFQNVILSLFEIVLYVAFLSLLRFSEYSIVLKTMSENELSIVRN